MIRPVSVLSAALIALCSGCAKPVYTVVPPAVCAAPVKPALPQLQESYLDNLENGKILAQRDDYLRQYIKSLEDTINCYERQTGAKE